MHAGISSIPPDEHGAAPCTTPMVRQLRLVFDEVAEGSASAVDVPLREAEEEPSTSLGTVTSLAAYALGLRPGDACFCCGAPLIDDGQDSGSERRGGLTCDACGAVVSGPAEG